MNTKNILLAVCFSVALLSISLTTSKAFAWGGGSVGITHPLSNSTDIEMYGCSPGTFGSKALRSKNCTAGSDSSTACAAAPALTDAQMGRVAGTPWTMLHRDKFGTIFCNAFNAVNGYIGASIALGMVVWGIWQGAFGRGGVVSAIPYVIMGIVLSMGTDMIIWLGAPASIFSK